MSARTDRDACAERLRQIGQLTRAGYTRQQIAWRLGVGVSTVGVYQRRIREGWVPRGSGGHPNSGRQGFYREDGFAGRVAGLYMSGLSMGLVAAELGVCKKTVFKALHARGVPVRGRVRSEGGDAAV